MMYRLMILTALLACSTAVQADPKPQDAPKVFGHRDANGRMVFSDQEQSGKQVEISKPSVVPDSKLGIKAYKRQTPNAYDRSRAVEESAARSRDRRVADAQEDEDWSRSRCENLREIISHSQYGSKTYRIGKQNQYDRECISNGY